jgi:branched-chain amino acid transport system permease protein
MIMGMIWAVVVASWNLIAGFVGIFSLGQIGFLGLGGYASALISMHLGLSPWVCMVAGGLMAGAASILIGIPLLRLRGAYIAMLTLAFSEVVHFLDSNLEGLTRGEMSLWGIPPLFDTAEKLPYYYSILLLFAVSIFLFYVFSKSRYRLAATAIKESENSAESLGVNVKKFKLGIFFVSAFFTGLVGGFYAHYVHLLSPTFLRFSHMIDVLAMGILGGIGTVMGPVLGAFVVTFFLESFRFIGEYRFLIYGILLILVILFKPQGLYLGIVDIFTRLNLSRRGHAGHVPR